MFLFLQNLGPFIFVVQSQGLKWISICGGTEVTGSSVLVDVLYQARINTIRLSFFSFFLFTHWCIVFLANAYSKN